MTEPIVNDLYETDFYRWTQAQADALRRRAANEIDWDRLAEEIETVGRSDRKEIRSRLEVLLIHLLKWHYQPLRRSASWEASIDEQRRRIAETVEESPSLAGYPAEALERAYGLAIIDKAVRRLELLNLPAACPWTIDQVLNADFLP